MAKRSVWPRPHCVAVGTAVHKAFSHMFNPLSIIACEASYAAHIIGDLRVSDGRKYKLSLHWSVGRVRGKLRLP